MKEISVLMEEGDIKVTNMVKWGRHGKIIVCANEEESEKLEMKKTWFSTIFKRQKECDTNLNPFVPL